MARGDTWILQNAHDGFDGDPVDVRPASGTEVLILSVLSPSDYMTSGLFFTLPSPSDGGSSSNNTKFSLQQSHYVQSGTNWGYGRPAQGNGILNAKILITNAKYLRIAATNADANIRWDYHISGIVVKD